MNKILSCCMNRSSAVGMVVIVVGWYDEDTEEAMVIYGDVCVRGDMVKILTRNDFV